ncbi:MAG: histone deacetylase family protein, partial [Rhodobacteraceae bacterium]|nr:histone deacetylase family protein [Paracoccaceae bacterium]
PGFARIAARIAGLGLPVLVVQEGGYLQPDLGANLTSFLSGLEG